MALFSLEHSKLAYRADFALYGMAVLALAGYLLLASPLAEHWTMLIYALVGLASWSAMEYGLHRFVLHGLQPFRRWHAAHHQRPAALICIPTVISALLIGGVVFLPALVLIGHWHASALTLGILAGYQGYAITHHAIHHWHTDSAWLKRRKRWHALHHYAAKPACYGVTSNAWDCLLGTRQQVQRQRLNDDPPR
ncbi:sterol desaturase family protein [Chitinimonas viridis]|uniref:Sterol desaturase family protein n=1 Tax=Chitinimonas viridis TaxID=664880 RepID=A0ABT8B071_9NEIS|nr:sterol desaturase family protein [Chitinimonas viridis]MDN3575493.1 sterol desaturase family protein [Chitinimonas viridis]